MGHKSEQQIASDYQISPELVRQWKQQAMEGISGAFRKGVKTREKELEEQLVLLRNALCKREIEVDELWTSDITYLQMERRNYYLCCVMDWESREILGGHSDSSDELH